MVLRRFTLYYELLGIFMSFESIRSLITCNKNELKFMGKCFCEPGWEATNITLNGIAQSSCNSPILNIGGCDCEPQDTTRSFLYNSSWFHHTGYRCTALCRWNTQVGMPISHIGEWKDNQEWKQLGFYTKDLPKTRHTHLRERLDEFSEAFHRWHYLNHSNLGDLIEFGAGGYTQTRNIFEVILNWKYFSVCVCKYVILHTFMHIENRFKCYKPFHQHIKVSAKSITLVDPLIHKYKEIPGCSYHSGRSY